MTFVFQKQCRIYGVDFYYFYYTTTTFYYSTNCIILDVLFKIMLFGYCVMYWCYLETLDIATLSIVCETQNVEKN